MNQYTCNYFVSFYADILEVKTLYSGITKPTKPALTRVMGYPEKPPGGVIFTLKERVKHLNQRLDLRETRVNRLEGKP